MNQEEQQLHLVQGPVLIVYYNDIFDQDENSFVQALLLTRTFPLLNEYNANNARRILLEEYHISSTYDYLFPPDVQVLRVTDLVRQHNIIVVRGEFYTILNVVRPDVCLVVGSCLARSIFGRNTTYGSSEAPIQWDDDDAVPELFLSISSTSIYNPVHSLLHHVW
ncbi:hypothetical protein HMPREF1544_08872 [Mucor circinelloides 1006PhL]|uniref:Uncharacterized protein n=1 Tax=Mucor circinelloides f. circinelloides (strain 1006PhL) TaxID=1220926 RepID=S2JP22_MUCC1|nr:hypothetical protein HMPREF1544_08872 [Mucor circinelloides 1006PhL]